jgi:hypothetical protein
VSSEDFDALTDEDQMAVAPESGQPPGGRDDPWDDGSPDAAHPWPPEHHAAPKDEL